MQQTKNFKLNKIELEDSPPDITVINPNWDKIDEQMQSQSDGLDTTNKNLANSDKNFADHIETHIESQVVSQRVRGENEPTYGLT